MTVEDDISAVWSEYHKFTARDMGFINKPVRSYFEGIFYGIYCGPMTNTKYDLLYTQGSKSGDPIDGLDLVCMLHDRYFHLPKSDIMFFESINIYGNYGMIQNNFNVNGAKRFVKLLRNMFKFYRCISQNKLTISRELKQ